MELIHIVGDELSARSNEIRELLNRNGIPYGFHDTTSPAAKRSARSTASNSRSCPRSSCSTIRCSPTRRMRRSWMPSVKSPNELSCDVVASRGRPGRTYRGSLRRLRVSTNSGHRAKRNRRAGRRKFPHQKLSRLSAWNQLRRANAASLPAGMAFRRKIRICPVGDRLARRLPQEDPDAVRWTRNHRNDGDRRHRAEYRRLGSPRLTASSVRVLFYTTFGGRVERQLRRCGDRRRQFCRQAAIHLAASARRVTLVVRGESARTRKISTNNGLLTSKVCQAPGSHVG